MLIDKVVVMKWNSKNIKYYESLGYHYTKIKDTFWVNVYDLPKYSRIKVQVKCDYCGMVFYKTWMHYIQSINNQYVCKDCCKECCNKKNKEVINKKYNVDNIINIDGVKEKIKDTNVKKYGVSNVFMSKEIKDKIKETNIVKYGHESPMQNDIVINKVKETCMIKYGVPCYLNLNYSGDNVKGENSPVWKGGIRNERTERLTSEYIEWRTKVYERDSFTCVKCKEHSSKLNAHHILNWKDNIEKRYDVDNGITLCQKCHNEFHKIYGKNNNTLEQLFIFLEYDKDIC